MPSPAFTVTLAALGGLCLGSFLNVVAHRLPAGASLVAPGSACPSCGTAIRPRDNIPVLSWLMLGGRCRDCRDGIPARYPIVEAVTALLVAAVVVAHDADRGTWLAIAFVAALVPIALIDLDHRIIPNRIVGPLAALAVVLTAALEPGEIAERLIAGAGAGAFLFAAVLAHPRGMGMGDVKLAATMGLVLGRAVAPALLVALIAGVIAGVAVMARKGVAEGRRTAIPFGPFLALGALVGVFAGEAIVDAYANAFL